MGDLVIIYVGILQVNIYYVVRKSCKNDVSIRTMYSNRAVRYCSKQIKSDGLSVLVGIMLRQICMITSALLIRLISSALV